MIDGPPGRGGSHREHRHHSSRSGALYERHLARRAERERLARERADDVHADAAWTLPHGDEDLEEAASALGLRASWEFVAPLPLPSGAAAAEAPAAEAAEEEGARRAADMPCAMCGVLQTVEQLGVHAVCAPCLEERRRSMSAPFDEMGA